MMVILMMLLITFILGLLVGLSINGKKIDKVIKEAKEQLEISKKLTKS